jgi:hypothetical protein
MPGEAHKLPSVRNDVSGLLRPLGCAEHFFHLFAQVYPVHFCVCAEIEGTVDAAALRSALDQVRERHPVLRARIAHGNELGTAFYKSDRPIELKTIYAGKEADWRPIVERELQRPMGCELLRVTALRAPNVTTIVLTFDHAIADGLSAVWILHDVLSALAGEQLEAFKSFSPVEEKLPVPSWHTAGESKSDSVVPTLSLTRPAAPLPPANLRPNIDTAEFTKEETGRLIERCRANNTTVHSMICAVAARCVPLSGQNVVGITSPFSVRKLARIERGACGVFMGAASTELQIKETASIWEDARRVGNSLSKARSPEAVIDFISQVSAEFPPSAGCEKAVAFLSAMPQTALVVSNLGVLPIAERYGPYAVKAVWGPAMLTNLPENRQAIGVCTFGGQLRIVHQSYVPIRGLARAIRDAIIAACAERERRRTYGPLNPLTSVHDA